MSRFSLVTRPVTMFVLDGLRNPIAMALVPITFALAGCVGNEGQELAGSGGTSLTTGGSGTGGSDTGSVQTTGVTDGGGPTSSGSDSTATAASAATATVTSGDSPKFDVAPDEDIPGAGDGDNGVGCKKIDFLFVVDNSASMSEEQQSLANSFPGFIQSIQNTVMAQDYHVMVIDTDAANPLGQHCDPAPTCCIPHCADHPNWSCNGMPCATGCDGELGAGVVKEANKKNDCGITGGNRYMVEAQPDLSNTFSCVALVGIDGWGLERPMEAMVEAVTTLNASGECNEGFLRDDAILVITFLTDEDDDGKSAGDPTSWKNHLVAAKNGDETAVVMLGLVGDADVGGLCAGAKAPKLRSFAEDWTYGSWGSICSPDYAPFFDQAVMVIDNACDDFKPAG